jgi:hypothetical protein
MVPVRSTFNSGLLNVEPQRTHYSQPEHGAVFGILISGREDTLLVVKKDQLYRRSVAQSIAD